MEEFGNSYLSRSLGTEALQTVENQEDSQTMTDAGIDLQEYTRDTGDEGNIESGGSIASGAQ